MIVVSTYSVCIVPWVSANHRDESEHVDDQDQENFSKGQPEFGFTVPLDDKCVDAAVFIVSMKYSTRSGVETYK